MQTSKSTCSKFVCTECTQFIIQRTSIKCISVRGRLFWLASPHPRRLLPSFFSLTLAFIHAYILLKERLFLIQRWIFQGNLPLGFLMQLGDLDIKFNVERFLMLKLSYLQMGNVWKVSCMVGGSRQPTIKWLRIGVSFSVLRKSWGWGMVWNVKGVLFFLDLYFSLMLLLTSVSNNLLPECVHHIIWFLLECIAELWGMCYE